MKECILDSLAENCESSMTICFDQNIRMMNGNWHASPAPAGRVVDLNNLPLLYSGLFVEKGTTLRMAVREVETKDRRGKRK